MGIWQRSDYEFIKRGPDIGSNSHLRGVSERVGGPSWYKPWSLVPEELGEDHHGEAKTTKIILDDPETCLQHFGACCILVLFPGTSQIFQKQIVSGTFRLRNPQISPFAISNNQFLVAELPNSFAWFVGPMFLANRLVIAQTPKPASDVRIAPFVLLTKKSFASLGGGNTACWIENKHKDCHGTGVSWNGVQYPNKTGFPIENVSFG